MRQLNITNELSNNLEADLMLSRYEARADNKKIDLPSQRALLDEIRKGNKDAVVKLVDSWEYVIIDIVKNEMKRQASEPQLFAKMFNAGRNGLISLAEKELDSTGREIFFRFGAWYVRQATIKNK